MRTVRCSGHLIGRSVCPGGVVSAQGVGGVCPGVSSQGGVFSRVVSSQGGVFPGGCLPRGGVFAQGVGVCQTPCEQNHGQV